MLVDFSPLCFLGIWAHQTACAKSYLMLMQAFFLHPFLHPFYNWPHVLRFHVLATNLTCFVLPFLFLLIYWGQCLTSCLCKQNLSWLSEIPFICFISNDIMFFSDQLSSRFTSDPVILFLSLRQRCWNMPLLRYPASASSLPLWIHWFLSPF